MKYIFIVNPKAGKETNETIVRNAIEQSSRKKECEVYLTKGALDATKFVKSYCEEHPQEEVRFIACGGDGTINEVFNGAVGHENASVTCFPCGSGNDFVKIFGSSSRFENVDKLLDAPVRKIDLLKVGDLYSDNVVNFGFDTTVAITVNEDRHKTGKGNKNSYTKGIIKALITSMKNTFKVYADGELLNPEGKALLCTVANGQYVGGSFKCAPKAKVDDGLMEVCLIKPISRLRFVKILTPYTNGEHIDSEEMKDIVVYRKAKKVEVEAPEGFAYSLDGEIIYDNHFTVEVAEKVVNFALPKE